MFRLESAAKQYPQEERLVTALAPVTLDIEAGEFVAIVGPSGSGKSTMLTLLGGMLAPTAGKVWFDEQSLYELDLAKRAEVRRLRMGFVFQTFNLVPYLTAQENVQIPLLLSGKSKSLQQARSLELLERVGLVERARHKPSQLSTGQQQRVALARTLANDPSVILTDEPTGNLDPEMRNQVLSFFEDFHQAGKTIVMVTHDAQAASRATRVLQMKAGQISESGRVEIRRVA